MTRTSLTPFADLTPFAEIPQQAERALTRVENWSDWDPALLASQGMRDLIIGPVSLGDDRAAVAWVAFLRDSLSYGINLTWDGKDLKRFEDWALWHLPPALSSETWAQQHRFGQLYYRKGPGYVIVRDARSHDDAFNIIIEGEPAISSFTQLTSVVYLPAATESVRELLALLDAEKLVAIAGDWATLLPYRMRSWPIPSTAV